MQQRKRLLWFKDLSNAAKLQSDLVRKTILTICGLTVETLLYAGASKINYLSKLLVASSVECWSSGTRHYIRLWGTVSGIFNRLFWCLTDQTINQWIEKIRGRLIHGENNHYSKIYRFTVLCCTLWFYDCILLFSVFLFSFQKCSSFPQKLQLFLKKIARSSRNNRDRLSMNVSAWSQNPQGTDLPNQRLHSSELSGAS